MCGRYTLTVSAEELMEYFGVDNSLDPFRPRYNIAPSQFVHAVINASGKNRIGQLKWGLVPSWSSNDKIGMKMINARAETVAEKPAFRAAFKNKRCLIAADGFYEWQRLENGSKQPFRIVLRNTKLFSFAGLYESWIAQNGIKISTCTIITTTPNKIMADIHDRMPVILSKDSENIWLDHNASKDDLAKLLQPYQDNLMEVYPVSNEVGNVKNNSSELIIRR